VKNLRVLRYLKNSLGVSEDQKAEWYRHWVDVGFGALEARLKDERRVGEFVFGGTPTLADICLVPQVWNAQRFKIPLDDYPTVVRLADNAMRLDAFKKAEPANQPDAEQ
jgi:maleylpyruvate isomerase